MAHTIEKLVTSERFWTQYGKKGGGGGGAILDGVGRNPKFKNYLEHRVL